MDKPVLPEIEHLRGKVTDEQLEAINDVLELKDSIKYLGRMVDRHGIRPDPDAVEAFLP